MRFFKSSAMRLPTSVLCIIALCGSLAWSTFLPPPAAAQMGTVEVAVVDFRNRSKMPGQMFGRMATDAIVLELLRSGKFGVTSADALEAKMKDLGYQPPLTPRLMIRLGQEVGATSVVNGEVVYLKVSRDDKQAEARITVRMLDVASGQLVNGAIATGRSHPRIGYAADGDKMLVEAIKDAARGAVETMLQYIIPEATVLSSIGTEEVLLNKGSQDGLQPGMEMIVVRRVEAGMEEVVGRVRVKKVTDSDATATIVRAPRGVKPEDRVRAVYELPPDGVGDGAEPARRAPRKKSLLSGSKLFWGLVALIGIATLFKGGGDRPEEVPGAVAAAGKSPEIASAFDEGGILIAWNNPKGVRHMDIIEYHVWRDNHGTFFASGTGGGGEANLAGPVLVPDQTSAAPISGAMGSFDHNSVDDIMSRSPVTYRVATADHELDTQEIELMTGITPGKMHTYWVSCLYRRISPVDASITYHETSPVFAGRATYIMRPILVAPGGTTPTDYIQLDNVTFEWEGSRSADLYRIECSTGPDFRRNETWCTDVYAPTSADGVLHTKTFTNVLNNVQELANLPAGSVVYWRVGARNRSDTPGPYPAGPSPSVDGPKNTRFIYSAPDQVFSFMIPGEAPGPPPGDGGDGDGGTQPPPPPSF